jgi:hypothetical protein
MLMTRFVLALVAILVLALSASNAHPQPMRQMPFSNNPLAELAVARDEPSVARATMSLLNTQSPVSETDLPLSAGDETPAPALLVYLAVVIAGSAIAVGLIRRSQGRQIR